MQVQVFSFLKSHRSQVKFHMCNNSVFIIIIIIYIFIFYLFFLKYGYVFTN